MPRTTNIRNRPPLGKLIAVLLKQNGKNQKWLSEQTQITQIYLCAILAGRANPTVKLLKRIAKSLQVDVRVLINAYLG